MINSIYIHIYAYTLAYTAVGCHGEEWIQIPASHRPDLVFQFLYCTQVTFCFSAVCDFFYSVRESNISGTAERICAKFTEKMYLVPRSDDSECQGQRSKVKVTRDKKRAVRSHHPRQPRNESRWLQITSRTIPSLPGVISAACVRSVLTLVKHL